MLLKTMRKKFEKPMMMIFYRLEHLYSEADRKDDKLFDVVADFAMLTTIYIFGKRSIGGISVV